jgi:hypothetical protein
MSIGFHIATAALPFLDTEAAQRAWEAYWRVGATRRLVSASLVSLLVLGAVPAQSQTTDGPAFGQRAAEFAKTAFRHIEQKAEWLGGNLKFQQQWVRDAALSYKAYQQSREAYTRLSHGNIAYSFVSALPTMDIGSQYAGGEEHVRIRPVFRPQDKLPKMQMPTLKTDWKSINWTQLGLDVDRSTVASANPDKGKLPQQLEKESAERGWASWKLVQDAKGVSTQNQANIGESAAYSSLTAEERAHLTKRVAMLRQVSLKTLEKYGEESPQYTLSLVAYQKALEASRKPSQSAEMIEKLRAIDAEAEAMVEAYAVHDQAMRMAALRGDAARENIATVAKKYDDPGPGSKLTSWLGLTPLMDTLSQIGKAPGPNVEDAAPRGAMGQAMKQVALAEVQAADQAEVLKLQARKAMEDAQERLAALAEKKRRIEAEIAQERSGENFRDRVALLKLDVDDAMTVLGVQAMAAQLPAGISPIVPDRLRAQVPGSISASRGADAIAENMKNGFAAAGRTSSENVEKTLKDAPGTIGLGVLSPIFVGLNKGMKSMTGRAFDLSGLRESKQKMF